MTTTTTTTKSNNTTLAIHEGNEASLSSSPFSRSSSISRNISSSSSRSIIRIKTILAPILVGSILMALGATIQSTHVFYVDHNLLVDNNVRRKTTKTSSKIGNSRSSNHRIKQHGSDSSILYNSPPKYERNKYTFNSFIVGNGIDLAKFGFENENNDDGNGDGDGDDDEKKNFMTTKTSSIEPYSLSTSSYLSTYSFQLFEDFDLSSKIKGNESWVELLELRRDAMHPTLSFYVDKVAFKRWLLSNYYILGIDGPKSFLLRYKSEIENEISFQMRKEAKAKKASNNIDNFFRRRRAASIIDDGDDNATLSSLSSIQLSSYLPLSLSNEILRWLPTDHDYAAKPTHLSCSGGVWLVYNDIGTNLTYVGNGKKKMKTHDGDDVDARTTIANDLAINLNKVQEKCGSTVIESYALRHVKPGIVIEERFTQPKQQTALTYNDENDIDDNDNFDSFLLKGGMEFKVFTIWGRAWLTVWRPGEDGVKALLHRNGTNLIFDPPPPTKKNKKNNDREDKDKKYTISTQKSTPVITVTNKLPKWIDWERVIQIAEKLGQHKDMFRTDIFVGVTTNRNNNNNNNTTARNNNNEQSPIIRYVVSETEIHPTPLRGFETIFNEAGRLWLAGYHYATTTTTANSNDGKNNINYLFDVEVIPNNEVPYEFY